MEGAWAALEMERIWSNASLAQGWDGRKTGMGAGLRTDWTGHLTHSRRTWDTPLTLGCDVRSCNLSGADQFALAAHALRSAPGMHWLGIRSGWRRWRQRRDRLLRHCHGWRRGWRWRCLVFRPLALALHPHCAVVFSLNHGPHSSQRSLHTAFRSASSGFTFTSAQCMPSPFNRSSTTSLCALSTMPLPIGQPSARKRGYCISATRASR